MEGYTKDEKLSKGRVEVWRRHRGKVSIERTIIEGQVLSTRVVRWGMVYGDGVVSSLSYYALSEDEADVKADLIAERAAVITQALANA